MGTIWATQVGSGGGSQESGNLVLLDTQTASNSATLDFTGSVNNATYQSYHFEITSLHPVSDNVELHLLASINDGSSYLSSNYKYGTAIADGGAGGNNSSTSDSKIFIKSNQGNDTGEAVNGEVDFYPSSDNTNVFQQFKYHLTARAAAVAPRVEWGSGTNTTTSDINAFRFLFSSGNIESGTIRMYGVLI